MKQEKDREVYNQKTLEAMKEAKKIARDSKYPSYENLDELKKALLVTRKWVTQMPQFQRRNPYSTAQCTVLKV